MADRRVLRLIQKWLKAGASEGGQWSETTVGTPQGAVTSPLIANAHLEPLMVHERQLAAQRHAARWKEVDQGKPLYAA